MNLKRYLVPWMFLMGTFVMLTGAKGGCGGPITQPTCTYGGKTYNAGDTFASTDGCNSCSCDATGQVACTLRACTNQCGGIAGLTCKNASDFCKMAAGTCKIADNMGTCTPKPQACDTMYAPVCGCDGKTYGNECSADTAGVAVDYKGECKSAGSSCKYDGKEYKDGESFPATDGCNTCTCINGQVGCTKRACPSPEQCGGLKGLTCSKKGDFCKMAAGTCKVVDNMGTCTTPPGGCPENYDPVCGCDGKTYSNECHADAASVSIDYKGACKNSGVICKYNGKEYKEGETFPAGDGCNTCTCDSNGNAACTKIACPDPKACGGIVGIACKNKGEFCKYPFGTCGAADQMGTCTVQPQACPEYYSPVCGCDGKTYGNECEADAAGASVTSKGECKVSGSSCKYNGQEYKDGETFPATDGCNKCTCSNGVVGCTKIACPPPAPCGGIAGFVCKNRSDFCKMAPGTCNIADNMGTCTFQPHTCPAIYQPVCGCNGKTYSNECSADAAGVAVDYKGACKTPGTCKYDGKEYKEGESFPATDGCNTCSCTNGQVTCTLRACQVCGGRGGQPCPVGQFCSFGPHCGYSDMPGVCAQKPQACTQQYDPVCGCDGQTYGNACSAASAGVSVRSKGVCGTSSTCQSDSDCAKDSFCDNGACKLGLACSYNGAKYPHGASFPAGDGCNTCSCYNGNAACTKIACGPQQCGGIAGLTCSNKTDFCKYQNGTCNVADRMGTCQPKPQACNRLYKPVCGCDGKTYSNSCEADAAGASVSKDGPC